jgi:hypothetical protein
MSAPLGAVSGFYTQRAGEALTFSLPGLYRSSREIFVPVNMESSPAWPGEVQLHNDALRGSAHRIAH